MKVKKKIKSESGRILSEKKRKKRKVFVITSEILATVSSRIAQECQHSFSAKGVTQPEVKASGNKFESECEKYHLQAKVEVFLGKKVKFAV